LAGERFDLMDLSYDELVQRVGAGGQPRFRAAQIWRWIYNSLTNNPDEMGN